jgi:succinate dehydrogenase flavin-adding protein (antitoxin of CptAB toxin-antitoxin module)
MRNADANPDADDTGAGGTGLAFSADRDRGILTPSDREFLLGRKTDYTEHSRKQKRNRIRRRLRNAILDFTILFEHLEERDRETVFNPDDDNREAYTRGITDMLAFLHLGTMGYYTPFKHMLAQGVNRAEQELAGSDYRMVSVEFNVDPVGNIDVDAVLEKLEEERFEEITDEELRAFVRLLAETDVVSTDEMRPAMKAHMSTFVERLAASDRARETAARELGNR